MPKRKRSTKKSYKRSAKAYKRKYKKARKSYKSAKRKGYIRGKYDFANDAVESIANYIPYGRIGLGMLRAGYRTYKKISGRGAYRVGRSIPFKRPGTYMASFAPLGRGATRVRHSEYLEDVITLGATSGVFYSEGGWLINPGNPETFPWLSTIAQRFQEYEFKGLVFEFRSTSANALNSTNTALGSVTGATEYNVTRPDFASKAEMDNYEWAVSGRPSQSLKFPVECKPGLNVFKRLYVNGALETDGTGTDPRLSWLGKFQLGLAGFQAASVNIGELWVHYDVCLYKPAQPAFQAATDIYGHFSIGNLTALGDYVQTGVDATHVWGTQVPCIVANAGSTVDSALLGSAGQVATIQGVNWGHYYNNSLLDVAFLPSGNNIWVMDSRVRMNVAFSVFVHMQWSSSVTTPTLTLAAVSDCVNYATLNISSASADASGTNWPGGSGTQGICYRQFRASTGSRPVVSLTPGADPATNLSGTDVYIRVLPPLLSGLAEVPIAYMMGEDLKHGWMRKEISLKPARKLKKLSEAVEMDLDAGDSKSEGKDRKRQEPLPDFEEGDWDMSESESECESDSDLSRAKLLSKLERLDKARERKIARTMRVDPSSQSRPTTPVVSSGLGLGPGPQISNIKPSTGAAQGSISSQKSCKLS